VTVLGRARTHDKQLRRSPLLQDKIAADQVKKLEGICHQS